MRQVVALDAARTPPDRDAVLRGQGIPAGAEIPSRVQRVIDQALELYAELAEPRGIFQETSSSDFQSIYAGEGLNAQRTPLERVFPRAQRLALFAVTLGEAVSREITELFGRNEPTLGYTLDAVASERADTAAELIADLFLEGLMREGRADSDARALAYSPGYCGWHITGQRSLFERLQPQRIGITLNASCLMQPLKSVSGVLAAGEAPIHDFDNDFDFCDTCSTYQCRHRIATLVGTRRERKPEGG